MAEFISCSDRLVILRNIYEEKGLSGLRDKVLKELNAWKNVIINIAVTGQAGAGKSAFVNAIRDVKAGDETGAKEGATLQTTKNTPYSHPNNKNVILWDVPGVGTDQFPQESYLQAINFDMFDIFIIISCSRFSENDKWLAEEVRKRGKRFYFVRSKFGLDVKNQQKQAKIKTGSPEVDVEKLRKRVIDDCQKNLKCSQSDGNDSYIFVIDNHQRTLYDLEEIKYRIISDTKESDKKEAIMYTLKALSSKNIKQKKEFLEKRIWSKALCAALAPSVLSIDVNILLKEQRFYMKQFGLDSNSLKHDTEAAHVTHRFEDYKKISELKSYELERNALMDEMKRTWPFILPGFNQIKFYGFSKQWLIEALDNMAKCAHKVQEDIAVTMVKDASQLVHKV